MNFRVSPVIISGVIFVFCMQDFTSINRRLHWNCVPHLYEKFHKVFIRQRNKYSKFTIVKFWCKLSNFMYSHVNISPLKGFEEPNDGTWRTWERVIVLAQQRGWGDSICTRDLLKTSYGHHPPPRSQNVPVNVIALSTPISVLFRVFVRAKRSRKLAVVQSLFHPSLMDVEAVLHLRIFFVCKQKLAFSSGARFFLS
jgi:hypothetical protein